MASFAEEFASFVNMVKTGFLDLISSIPGCPPSLKQPCPYAASNPEEIESTEVVSVRTKEPEVIDEPQPIPKPRTRPLIKVLPEGLRFATVTLPGGEPEVQQLTITSVGTELLRIGGCTDTSDGDFNLKIRDPYKKELDPGESTTVKYSFSPTTRGDKSAVFTVSSNAENPEAGRATFSGLAKQKVTPVAVLASKVIALKGVTTLSLSADVGDFAGKGVLTLVGAAKDQVKLKNAGEPVVLEGGKAQFDLPATINLDVEAVESSAAKDDVVFQWELKEGGPYFVIQPAVSEKLTIERCDATVTIGHVVRGNPYVPRDAPSPSDMPDSVPPSKTYEVQVTVTWSKESCAGQHIDLSIINGSQANGTATVSPTQIAATTVVTVTGGAQTGRGHVGNLKIQAKLDGVVKAESPGFTVCAHPINWRDTLLNDLDDRHGVGIRVEDDWDSDSGTFADLGQTEIAEVVRLGPIPSPPFEPLDESPLSTSDYLPGNEKSVDQLQEPRPSAGPAATLLTEQLSIFKCLRCGATDKTQPNSGMNHTDEVFQVDTNWFHRTVRVGAAITVGGYSTQAADVNITSGNHALR